MLETSHISRLQYSAEAEEEYDYVVARNEDAAHHGYLLCVEIGADEYEDTFIRKSNWKRTK